VARFFGQFRPRIFFTILDPQVNVFAFFFNLNEVINGFLNLANSTASYYECSDAEVYINELDDMSKSELLAAELEPSIAVFIDSLLETGLFFTWSFSIGINVVRNVNNIINNQFIFSEQYFISLQ
jgi:hypothetical protein